MLPFVDYLFWCAIKLDYDYPLKTAATILFSVWLLEHGLKLE